MTTRLKPLSELVGDVQLNDVVQFYITRSRTEGEFKEPKKSYTGYYRFYDDHDQVVGLSIDPDSQRSDLYVPLVKGVGFVDVSHYLILQRANENIDGGSRE